MPLRGGDTGEHPTKLEPDVAQVVEEIGAAGLATTVEQRRCLAAYTRLVRRWGRNVNLVGRGDLDRLARRHLLESFNVIRPPIKLWGGALVDLGSGAGFPGVPLAILHDDLEALLVESVRKKASFLETVVESLALDGRVRVFCGRAESAIEDPAERERYDTVTARGTGPLEKIVAWSSPFLKRGGHLVAFKGTGRVVEQEIARAMSAMERAGMALVDVAPMRWGIGTLVVLAKRLHVAKRLERIQGR